VTGRSLTSVFAYARPNDLDGALALLTEVPGARPLGGGTDLLVALRKAAHRPPLVIDLKRIGELTAGIEERDGWLRIAATTVMTDVTTDERIRVAFPALAEAAEVVGSIQIRNRATLAGNLCNASPAADTVPALLVYGAVVEIVGPSGRRRIAADELITGPGRTTLAADELISAVELPLPRERRGSAFGRITRRRGVDLATVNLCCSVSADGTTRFAFGAVGPRAFVVADDEGILADPSADEATRDETLRGIFAAATPISNVRASREYRLAMVSVLGRRALDAALARLEKTDGAA
jgi:CO/xanthine dehydrogenase FAD-binding subunit